MVIWYYSCHGRSRECEVIFLKIDFDRLLQLRNFHHRSVSGFAENCTLAGISSLSTATRFAGLAAEGERGNPRGPKNRFYPLIAKKPLNNMVQGLLPISASHPPLPPSERKRSYASEKKNAFVAGLSCLDSSRVQRFPDRYLGICHLLVSGQSHPVPSGIRAVSKIHLWAFGAQTYGTNFRLSRGTAVFPEIL